MTRSDLIDFVSNAFSVPLNTVAGHAKALSAAGMLTVGEKGPGNGARMTSRDAVNMILACAINSKYKQSVAGAALLKESVVERVQRVRDMRSDPQGKITGSPDFAPDLPFFRADTAGAAIDALVDAARTGLIVRWADHKNYFINVTMESRGEYVLLGLNLEQKTAICGFGQTLHPLVEEETRLSFMLLAMLAKKLGPPG